jgi:hypothetical protein
MAISLRFFLRCTTLSFLRSWSESRPCLARDPVESLQWAARHGLGPENGSTGTNQGSSQGFFIEKGCGENPGFTRDDPWYSMDIQWYSSRIHGYSMIFIQDSWIFNDIHGGKKTTSVHFVCLATKVHFPVASGPTSRPVDFSPTWVGWVRKTSPSYGSQRVNGP